MHLNAWSLASIIDEMSNDLFTLIQSGDAEGVRHLLDADPNVIGSRNDAGLSGVLIALYHRQPDIARLLVERGAPLDLHEACAYGDVDRVRELADADPESVNRLSPDGFPPVALAAFFGNAVIVRLLLDRGADPNQQAQNPMKVAALHAAVARRDAGIVRMLLEAGADPNARQQADYTAMRAAVEHNDEEIVGLLRKHGATA